MRYARVGPGVDLLVKRAQEGFELVWLVSPGASTDRLSIGVTGARAIERTAEGDALLHALGGVVRLARPRAYQDVRGRERAIEARFVVEDGGLRVHVGRTTGGARS